jgi:hypothetical protein
VDQIEPLVRANVVRSVDDPRSRKQLSGRLGDGRLIHQLRPRAVPVCISSGTLILGMLRT